VLSFAQQTASQSSTAAEELQGLAEVVVSAQRREENLQDVPISVTALGADQLAQAHITDIAGLSMLAPASTLTRRPGGLNHIFAASERARRVPY